MGAIREKPSRIFLSVSGKPKWFLWIRQSEQGDFYLGFNDPTKRITKAGKFNIPPNNPTRVAYEDLPPLEETLPPGKISYHATGIVHAKDGDGSQKLFEVSGTPVIPPKEPRCIAEILSANPTSFGDFDGTFDANRDIAIPTEQFEGNPFAARVYICPKEFSAEKLAEIDAQKNCVAVLVNRDVMVAFVLYRKTSFTAWPPETYVMYSPEGPR